MANVSLEFDGEQQTLLIRGATDNVARHPLFAAYLRQNGGRKLSNGDLELPTSSENLTSRYQAVAGILQRLGVDLQTQGEASEVLARVEAAERQFATFSKRALEIWQANIDTEEFRQFIDTVEQKCPGRRFYRKQLLAAFHLAYSLNTCNFSVPGAGKTSIVYAAYAYLRNLPPTDERHVDRLLIVGPLSSFKAWEAEYRDIFHRPPNSRRISGALTSEARADYLRGIDFGSRNVEITLTSYPTLASSEDEFRRYLGRPDRRTMLVLDEAHYIKRGDGIWSAAALRLAPLASARVALTGTPAPNGYEDLSNLFKFIYPNKDIVGFPPASLRAMTDGLLRDAIPALKSNIRPFYTRIKKSDLNLPRADEERIPVPMSETHEKIYRSLERRIVPQLRHDLDNPNAPVRVRAKLIRLRQASANPELLLRPIEQETLFDTEDVGAFSVNELEVTSLIQSFSARTDLKRLDVCADLVDRILESQGKVLIWSYFLGNLNLLFQKFRGRAPFVEVLTGATPVMADEMENLALLATREGIIDRFHEPDEKSILIANPQAVGESISLHKACRTAIYFDRDFNAGRFIQSKDRIHRYSATRTGTVQYLHLVSSSTVDDDIDVRLQEKERRLADLVDSEEIPLLAADTTTDADDIRAILEAYERRKIN